MNDLSAHCRRDQLADRDSQFYNKEQELAVSELTPPTVQKTPKEGQI